MGNVNHFYLFFQKKINKKNLFNTCTFRLASGNYNVETLLLSTNGIAKQYCASVDSYEDLISKSSKTASNLPFLMQRYAEFILGKAFRCFKIKKFKQYYLIIYTYKIIIN